MKRVEVKPQPAKVEETKKSTDRPAVDFNKPMTLGDFEKSFANERSLQY